MTCKECIHKSVCYRVDSVPIAYAQKCRDFESGKALEQPKAGHWIEENINEWSRKVFCSECGCSPPFEHVSNGDIYSASGYGVNNKTKYCPNCGAKMQEEEWKK